MIISGKKKKKKQQHGARVVGLDGGRALIHGNGGMIR